MTRINYDSKGRPVATKRMHATGFTIGKAQLIIVALAITAFSMILGSM